MNLLAVNILVALCDAAHAPPGGGAEAGHSPGRRSRRNGRLPRSRPIFGLRRTRRPPPLTHMPRPPIRQEASWH